MGKKMSCYRTSLPVELLEIIVEELLDLKGRKRTTRRGLNGRDGTFAPIASFSLVSRQLRQVAFRVYFREVKITSIKDLNRISAIPAWSLYARTLTTTTIILLSTSQSRVPLRSLRLKHLSLSFNATTIIKLRTATYSLVPLFSASFTSLSLTHLPSIRRSLLSTIAGSCPELESLELSVVERLDDTCCIDCLEESACCIVHSALGDRTSEGSVEDLAVSYATALKPLTHLRHLSLGIFLSPDSVLFTHLTRHLPSSFLSSPAPLPNTSTPTSSCSPAVDICSAPQTPAPGTHHTCIARLYSCVSSASAKPIPMPTNGEAQLALSPDAALSTPSTCARCRQKHLKATKKLELTASARVAQILKGLQSVAWSSWFVDLERNVDGSGEKGENEGGDGGGAVGTFSIDDVDDGGGDGGEERDERARRWARFWIARREGRVKLRGRPW
ncbi:uncharacterized protein STEHIDRAFT_156777 [Stereum hirsutum FP-91666 SS1]|uniref:uncharacterized protein n=1 Tax=Stereum hirsutum (strain FP-91666) TaxID=721885 RepID=UPI000440B166|nr:uncharacterized protein STEHIDRAFT_156777 [Stereum hirsutum FP-91666 SS1]EIM86470.1 hypothetical protein STEHIDRAFT_156777 [Stereum hirsutum FP-91666 SS1]